MSTYVRSTFLIADSDSESRRSLAAAIEAAGYLAAQASTVADARDRLEAFPYAGLVVDMRLSGGDGLEVLDLALSRYPGLPCVVTESLGSIHHAVQALKRGAADYVLKPYQTAQIVQTLLSRPAGQRRAAMAAPPQPVTSEARRPMPGHQPGNRPRAFSAPRLVGSGAGMQRLVSILERVAPTQSTVLIQGETGTGKELVARTVHENSPRRDHPFVAFNAAAIPEGLVEAELFGHVKGAFSGAVSSRMGRFEAANQGTLFIDEVSSMPLPLQAKLLRALQEREIERVGTCQPIKVNVRVVAAANVDLKSLVKSGAFREDLYYRLSVVRVELPPLRARPEDIPGLVRHFVALCCEANGVEPKTVSHQALQMLMRYPWPGNVRQLQNAVEHAVAMSGTADEILPETLPEEVTFDAAESQTVSSVVPLLPMPEEGIDFASTMTQVERELILRYLEKAGGNKRQAARLLSLSRTTLIDKLHRLGVTSESAAETAA